MAENETYTPAAPAAELITLAMLAGALGLPETATAADVAGRLAALSRLDKFNASLETRLKKLEQHPAGAGAAAHGGSEPTAAALSALSARLEAIEQRLAQHSSAAEQAERERLVAEASREGKVIPLSGEQVQGLALETLRALIAGLPKGMVALSTRTANSGKTQEVKGLARAAAAFRQQLAKLES